MFHSQVACLNQIRALRLTALTPASESNTFPDRDLAYLTTTSRLNTLCGRNGLSAKSTTLSRAQVFTGSDLVRLLHNLLALGQDQFDVAWVRHVRVDLQNCQLVGTKSEDLRTPCSRNTYTTVGSVSTSALLGGLVDLDVLDNQVAGVKTLGIGVGLCVLQKSKEKLGRLGGPSSTGYTKLLACKESLPSAFVYLQRSITMHQGHASRIGKSASAAT
jgi:hypothetical protein